ncbi:MAG TPA: endopeptidase La, partial [Bacillota bacterium]|nr:endopeptidase La [Bacillota bacterium]
MSTNFKQLPLLALRGIVIFPMTEVHLNIGRKESVLALEQAMMENQQLFVTAQKQTSVTTPKEEDVYQHGTIVHIKHVEKLANGTFRVFVKGETRAKVSRFLEDDPFFTVEVETLEDIHGELEEEEALKRFLFQQFSEYMKVSRKITEEVFLKMVDIKDASHIGYMIASNITIKASEKQTLLEIDNVPERLQTLITYTANEKKIVHLESDIHKRVTSSMEKTQKEYYLREQLKAIQTELGESDGTGGEIGELRKKIQEASMPESVEMTALKELERFERIPQASGESGIIRNYIDWLISIPWTEKTEDIIEMKRAKAILDADHYGLEKVKERILEYLAVQKLTNETKGPILCLVGPPGVGKTSLANSIARSINRSFVRASLGGVRDESEIRGHRRTYIGAMPGRIMQGMNKAKTTNPVFLLDEIDKMSNDFRGDPSSAMLEVLDPEQNNTFSDHYIEVEYDLSNVLFIATANYMNNIPAPLLDRMEVISISGYTEVEKVQIAKRHLISKQLEENGLTGNQLQFREKAILQMIRRYTREAGVRSLERQIATICRKAAKQIVSEEKKRVVVTEKTLPELLGKPVYRYGQMEEEHQVGAATGLAYTAAGGDILSIEVTHYPGKGELSLTGKLGDVMKESAQAAFSYIRSRAEELQIDPDFYQTKDIHIHVPEGATPKDGPSAGITMATALISALTGRAVRKEVGMTGEITLRGRVLPIGGLKEKSLSAHRSGISTIIIPQDNEKDIEDIPESVK